jgi:hypothetical protein
MFTSIKHIPAPFWHGPPWIAYAMTHGMASSM